MKKRLTTPLFLSLFLVGCVTSNSHSGKLTKKEMIQDCQQYVGQSAGAKKNFHDCLVSKGYPYEELANLRHQIAEQAEWEAQQVRSWNSGVQGANKLIEWLFSR